MSRVFFISDHHFGHMWMANHRRFQDEHSMNDHMIQQHNKVVNKKDLVYFLGDVVWRISDLYLLDQMKGRKILIMGNHDDGRNIKEYLKYFEYCTAMFRYKGMFVSHCPIHPQELNYRVKYNIHGHLHEHNVKQNLFDGREPKINYKDDERYINVSCEQLNYTPIEFTELMKKHNIEKKADGKWEKI